MSTSEKFKKCRFMVLVKEYIQILKTLIVNYLNYAVQLYYVLIINLVFIMLS